MKIFAFLLAFHGLQAFAATDPNWIDQISGIERSNRMSCFGSESPVPTEKVIDCDQRAIKSIQADLKEISSNISASEREQLAHSNLSEYEHGQKLAKDAGTLFLKYADSECKSEAYAYGRAPARESLKLSLECQFFLYIARLESLATITQYQQ